MSDFPRLVVRNPHAFDIVGDSFHLCGFGSAFEGVIGTATLTDHNGVVLAAISPLFVPGSGSLFTLFEFPVTYGVPMTAEGTLTVEADNPSGLPENEFRVTVPLTFGRPLLGSSFAGFSQHRVLAGDTLFSIAQHSYGDGNLWPRLFTANRDRISDPNLIRVGQVLRIPFGGP
jgi:nucleoid-associated protein YgaU